MIWNSSSKIININKIDILGERESRFAAARISSLNMLWFVKLIIVKFRVSFVTGMDIFSSRETPSKFWVYISNNTTLKSLKQEILGMFNSRLKFFRVKQQILIFEWVACSFPNHDESFILNFNRMMNFYV